MARETTYRNSKIPKFYSNLFGNNISNILIVEQIPNKFNRIKKRYISQIEINFKKKPLK